MPHTAGFTNSPIIIRDGDVVEVRSHEHALLQCMDIILGSMYFRLNDMHLVIPEGLEQRGKRTVAKEKLYEYIIENINDIVPNFNIFETTSVQDETEPECYWNHAYRHWRYIPE